MIKISSLTPMLVVDGEVSSLLYVDLANNKVYNNDGLMLAGGIVDEVLQHIDKRRHGMVAPNNLGDRIATLHQKKDLQKTRTNERLENARKRQPGTNKSDREAQKETVHETTDETKVDSVDQGPELG